jgi:hypothetical protein
MTDALFPLPRSALALMARNVLRLRGHMLAQFCHSVLEQRNGIDVEPFREAKYHEESRRS